MTIADTIRLAEVRDLARSGRAREIREHAGLSISEVARTVLVSVPTVSRWEKGQRAPRGDAAIRYARLLDALGGMGTR